MNRLMEYTVFSGFVTAWRLATWPTRRSPVLVIATTEGVVRPPSWLGITTGSPPCITATTELVVPKSIPIILLICQISLLRIAKVCESNVAADGAERGSDTGNRFKIQFDAGVSIKVECINVNLLDDVSMHCNFMKLQTNSLQCRRRPHCRWGTTSRKSWHPTWRRREGAAGRSWR